ncbi:MAG: arsenate reductase ArsC [Flavobacteriaceae bacterium]|jgi:arsenate reductase|uniref:Arsenate reductase n=1 Tax=Flavobacterium frigoris (strain PS1) TaxID=1086011 RepID=H7FVW3_FLAFP|nr:arsenate reductase ArsC [Flavobacterium frigoris]EIA07374.1 arsenate reductase [Flavobacterium frigoris PS1]MBX9889108.1 arsenate reductase ArsC [Flavobacteriaceae bacterium]
MKKKVLFLCIHNSARSQMAEAYLKKIGGDKFEVESAGLEAGNLNPFAVAVMKEEGIDISSNQTNDVFDFFKQGRLYRYVITVCDKESSDRCPIFPGMSEKINWSFSDPSSFTGTEEEKLQKTRKVRDQIKEAVQDFVKQLKR